MSSIIVLDSSDEEEGSTGKRLRLGQNSKQSKQTRSALNTPPLKSTFANNKIIKAPSASNINTVKTDRMSTPVNSSTTSVPTKLVKSCPIPRGITISRVNPATAVGAKVYPLITAASGITIAPNDTRIVTKSVQLKGNSTFKTTLNEELSSNINKTKSSLQEPPNSAQQMAQQGLLSPLQLTQKSQINKISIINQPPQQHSSLSRKTPKQIINPQIRTQIQRKNLTIPQIKQIFHPVRVTNSSTSHKQHSPINSGRVQLSKTLPHLAAVQNVPPQLTENNRETIPVHPTTSPILQKSSPKAAGTFSSEYATITTSAESSSTPVSVINATTMVPMLPMITSVQSMAPSATPPLKLLATPPHTTESLVDAPDNLSPELLSPARAPPEGDSIKYLKSTDTLATTTTIIKTSLLSSPVSSPIFEDIPQSSPTGVSNSSLSAVTRKRRRIQPTTLLKSTDQAWLEKRQNANLTQTNNNNNNTYSEDRDRSTVIPSTVQGESMPIEVTTSLHGNAVGCDDETELTITKVNTEKKPVTICMSTEYEELLKACREADNSEDMNKLIKIKMIKYYHNAHSDYLRSRSFRKSILTTIELIKRKPDLVYLHLKPFLDELKVRRRSKDPSVDDEKIDQNQRNRVSSTASNSNLQFIKESDSHQRIGFSESVQQSPTVSTGNKQTDLQIKKLNRTLHILKKHIDRLEELDVDWDDEDSSYMRLERLKKRACLIYNKICDLTGESRNAHRLDKKPIKFNGTEYKQFNKTLQAYINRTKAFPDFCDVLRLFEYCNETCGYSLAPFQAKRVAQDAFIEVGKLLQARRKTDLYETVTHFTANAKDPAQEDPDLLAKLSDNRKKHTKIIDVLDKYAREQDMNADELRLARLLKVSSKDKESTGNYSLEKIINNDQPSPSLNGTESDEMESKDRCHENSNKFEPNDQDVCDDKVGYEEDYNSGQDVLADSEIENMKGANEILNNLSNLYELPSAIPESISICGNKSIQYDDIVVLSAEKEHADTNPNEVADDFQPTRTLQPIDKKKCNENHQSTENNNKVPGNNNDVQNKTIGISEEKTIILSNIDQLTNNKVSSQFQTSIDIIQKITNSNTVADNKLEGCSV